jgi:hypothetical protein
MAIDAMFLRISWLVALEKSKFTISLTFDNYDTTFT